MLDPLDALAALEAEVSEVYQRNAEREQFLRMMNEIRGDIRLAWMMTAMHWYPVAVGGLVEEPGRHP